MGREDFGRLADISDKVCQGSRFTVGLCTLLMNHPVVPQPSTTSWELVSPSWCLSGACCSPSRVVWRAELQGLIAYLYTRRCFHILTCRFHGARSVPDRLPSPASASRSENNTRSSGAVSTLV